jgi:uncharacterized membrane protein/uncharacterized protein YeaO (DUF488 family)
MLNFFKPKKQNAISVVKYLLESLKVKVTKHTISKTLTEHPDYPNLSSICDSLSEWHLPNQAYNIKKADFDANDLYYPFIAHSKENGGRYLLVHHIQNQQVLISDEQGKNATLTEQEFLVKWSGIALHATATAKSGEKDYAGKRVTEIFNQVKLPLLLCIGIGILVKQIDPQLVGWSYLSLFVIKLLGIAISVLLLIQSVDANNPFIQNLCSLGKKNGCNAILKSDAAKLTPWLSWSEVGFFYFTGSCFTLLFVPAATSILAWLSVLALPYTIYSISYQYRHKNLCILCCSVQALLALEFLTVLLGSFKNQLWPLELGTSAILSTSIAFSIPVLTWSIYKNILLNAKKVKPLQQQLKKFKYNTELFQQILKAQPKYGIGNELMPIVLGNPKAETTITMVSNPFCGPCAQAHQVLDEWLSYRNDIQIKLIFSTADHDDDQKTKVARHISALSLLNDTLLIETALNDWYSQSSKKYDEWANRYPVELSEQLAEVTAKQKAWCELTEITFTPTILVNGYKLPAPYRLEDIKYLLS